MQNLSHDGRAVMHNGSMDWRPLPLDAKLYALIVIAVGGFVILTSVPSSFPQPWLFVALLVLACVTSAWKVQLQLSPNSDSTLSVSYAADLMALVLLVRPQGMFGIR